MKDKTTKSEADTCAFFSSINFDLKKIPVSNLPREKRPDYFFTGNDVRIFVEVKELEENKKERQVSDSINAGEFNAYDQSNCSERIRNKINDANSQLKKLCVDSNPGILILQDVRPFYTRNLWLGRSIQDAMFGARTIWRTVPTHLSGYKPGTVADVFSSSGRATRSDRNMHVSCIGVLSADEDPSRSKLTLFHNPYALFPLCTTDISNPRISHFERKNPHGSYEDWNPL